MENPLDEKILKQVAKLHKEAISTGFLPTLGEEFLFCLYKAISLSDKAVLLVDVENDDVRGFVAGSLEFEDIKRILSKECKYTLLKVSVKLLLNPKRLFKFLETYRYTERTERTEELDLPSAELLSIAVKPNYRKRGIATNLYKALISYMERWGVGKFKIVVGKKLKKAQKFYEKMGAKKIKEFELHKGEKSFIYTQKVE